MINDFSIYLLDPVIKIEYKMNMPKEIGNRFILEKSHLTKDTHTNNISQIISDLLGLHATNTSSAYISLFCRGKDFTTDVLHELLYKSKNIAKIRCIRGTVFFHHEDLIPTMHVATLKYRLRQMQKRLDYIKIGNQTLLDYKERILDLLKNKPLTIREIREKLQTDVDLSSILIILSDLGLIVRSKPRNNWLDRMHTYELFEEAVPNVKLDSITEQEAIEKIILQYVNHYGPVCLNDIVWWTGFGKTVVKESLEKLFLKLTTIDVNPFNQEFYISSDQLILAKVLNPAHESIISLLPILDPYIMGYKFRDRYIEEGKDYIFDRSGNATNTIILNGVVVGIWDWELDPPLIKYFLFGELSKNQLELLTIELKEMGNFLMPKPFEIKKHDSMGPLTKRTAGWVLKPLRDT